jgi:tetratricopeptide (TPR) repeat protein
MASPSTSIFVVSDFTIGGSLPALRDYFTDESYDRFAVRWPGGEGVPPAGHLWRDVVEPGIRAADRCLAFVDKPNANVGFEIGYALGLGRPVALAHLAKEAADWTKASPLRGIMNPRLQTASGVEECLAQKDWKRLASPPKPGAEVLLLCPEVAWDTHLRKLREAKIPFRTLPKDGWSIDDLPKQLEGVGLVLWWVLPHNDGKEARDGDDNARLAVVAGYAGALAGVRLEVAWDAGARAIADILGTERDLPPPSQIVGFAQSLIETWQAEFRKAQQTAADPSRSVAPRRPALARRNLPALPPDSWEDLAQRFFGRVVQLRDADAAIRGMLGRFKSRTRTGTSGDVQILWVHGFGGMGKSWFLHRVRRVAFEKDPRVRTLIVDYDPRESNGWRYPLQDSPVTVRDALDPIACRLAQVVGLEEAADPYWEAVSAIQEAAPRFEGLRCKLEEQLQELRKPVAGSIDTWFQRFLEREFEGRDLLSQPHDVRCRRLEQTFDTLEGRKRLLRALCEERRVGDEAILDPDALLTRGLGEALRATMRQHPLVVMLDTAELLDGTQQARLRELFLPLITGAEPLLLLVGSRLRPDLDQSPGSRNGWMPSFGGSLRSEAFAESVLFTVSEIEAALANIGTERRPLPGDPHLLAEQIHRTTLGVPLAVRTLFDEHLDGGRVLAELSSLETPVEGLKESKAVRRVIAVTAERMLLHLAQRPERLEDYRAIVLLGVLPSADPELLRYFWSESPLRRLASLAKRYSLLADGDLHPTVRSTLRRCWARVDHRPEFFEELLETWARILTQTKPADPLARDTTWLRHQLWTWNRAFWVEPPAVTVDGLARALACAWIYEHPTQGFETLVREMPAAAMPAAVKLPGSTDSDLEAGAADDMTRWAPWLEAQARHGGSWSREEIAALDLIAALLGPSAWNLPAAEAQRRWDRVRGAIDLFGIDRTPRRAEVAEACEYLGYALDPDPNVPCRYGSESVEAYQMAVRLGRSTVSLMNNLANQFQDRLGRYKDAEAAYRKAMELDPKDADPHNGLCLLYQFHLDRWREAGEAIDRAIKLAPDIFNFRETQGLYLEESGDLVGAERAFREGFRCQPSELDNTVGIGWVALHSRDDIAAAREALASLSVSDRALPSATLLEAGLVVWEGRWAEAQPLLIRWIRGLPATLSHYPWTQRSRWCALMRRSGVPIPWSDWYRLFTEASGPGRWTEWVTAIEALREGRPAAELSERRSRWIVERFTRPGHGA